MEPTTEQDKDRQASAALAEGAGRAAGKGVWMGTAVGIGSAAIVAALLYARRKR